MKITLYSTKNPTLKSPAYLSCPLNTDDLASIQSWVDTYQELGVNIEEIGCFDIDDDINMLAEKLAFSATLESLHITLMVDWCPKKFELLIELISNLLMVQNNFISLHFNQHHNNKITTTIICHHAVNHANLLTIEAIENHHWCPLSAAETPQDELRHQRNNLATQEIQEKQSLEHSDFLVRYYLQSARQHAKDPSLSTPRIKRGQHTCKTSIFYHRAIEINQGLAIHLLCMQDALNLYEAAKEYQQLYSQQHLEAVTCYTAYIHFFPADIEAYLNRSYSYAKLGYHEAVRHDIATIKQLNPQETSFYKWVIGLDPLLVDDLLTPEDAPHLYQLGQRHQDNKNNEQAIPYFCAVTRLKPTELEAYFALQRAYEALSRPNEAKDIFIKINQLNPQRTIEILSNPDDVLKTNVILGKGAFSCVSKGIWKNQYVAIKKISYQKNANERWLRFRREVELQSSFSHPNIMPLLAIYIPDQNAQQMNWIMMPLMPLGSLSKVLNDTFNYPLPWPTRLTIAQGIIAGLLYLHDEKNIIHHDLKSDNILLAQDMQAKITDFNLSESADRTHIAAGSLAWLAPEKINLPGLPRTSSKKSDIYSFGMLVWALCHRAKPYSGKTSQQIANLLFGRKYETISSTTPGPFKALMKKCWQDPPNERPSAQELRDELSNSNFLQMS